MRAPLPVDITRDFTPLPNSVLFDRRVSAWAFRLFACYAWAVRTRGQVLSTAEASQTLGLTHAQIQKLESELHRTSGLMDALIPLTREMRPLLED